MKKALQISIAQSLFTIEEDAYTALNIYLDSIRSHFAKTEGKNEIISDIEARIAEQFTETGHTIITKEDVDQVIGIMGKVEDFGDEEAPFSSPQTDKAPQKKLYRSTDDVIVGGVCAGLAAYLGIEVVWVRIIFLILLFFTGFGVGLYLVFWILVPEARTASQKLEMTGNPVNLESLSENVKDKVNTFTKENRSRIEQILAIPFDFLKRITPLFWPVVCVITGCLLTIGAILGIIGMSLAVPFFHYLPNRLTDFPIAEIFPGAMGYILLSSVYIVCFIPILLILILGISILKRKNILQFKVGVVLFIIWIVALVTAGGNTLKSYLNYNDVIGRLPEYAFLNEEQIPLTNKDIHQLTVTSGLHVNIFQGNETKLTFMGRRKELNRLSIDSQESNLSLGIKNYTRQCIFCDREPFTLMLTVPSLDQIRAYDGSHVETGEFTLTTPFSIDLGQGADSSLIIHTPEINASLKNGAFLNLSGTASGSTLSAEYGSSLQADNFKTNSAKVLTEFGSSATINASEELNATAENDSIIIYTGNPNMNRNEKTGGKIQSIHELSTQEGE